MRNLTVALLGYLKKCSLVGSHTEKHHQINTGDVVKKKMELVEDTTVNKAVSLGHLDTCQEQICKGENICRKNVIYTPAPQWTCEPK